MFVTELCRFTFRDRVIINSDVRSLVFLHLGDFARQHRIVEPQRNIVVCKNLWRYPVVLVCKVRPEFVLQTCVFLCNYFGLWTQRMPVLILGCTWQQLPDPRSRTSPGIVLYFGILVCSEVKLKDVRGLVLSGSVDHMDQACWNPLRDSF